MTVQIFKSVTAPPRIHPWYVRLVAANGQTLVVSEGYFSKWNAQRAARRMFPDLPVRYVPE